MNKNNIWFCIFASIISLLPLSGYPAVMIMGGLTYEYSAGPGEKYTGEIVLKNPEEKMQEIKIYQTDYYFYADQRVIYGDPGVIPRSNANWITYTPKRAEIPPGQEMKIFYTVQVPDNTELKGSFWSMFMVEEVPADSGESSSTKSEEVTLGLRQVFRYGIQVVTHIGDTGTKKIQFIGSRLIKTEDNKQVLQLDVENTGERMMRATLWAELYDMKGQFIGKFEGGILRIYPTTSVRFQVDLTNIPKSNYKAVVIVDCGGDNVFGANINLVLKQ